MIAVWKKEVQNYFLSPIAYIFMAIFMTHRKLLRNFFLNQYR